MGAIRPWHIAILVVVLILLFGAKKLPDAARGLGRSLRIIKAETQSLRDDEGVKEKADAQYDTTPLKPEIQDNEPSSVSKPQPVDKSTER
jgi:sec-independent protein translocase protein TatA